MTPDGETTPSVRVDARPVSPSPAHEALRSTLAAADRDRIQTLKKQKSWMASLRDVVQRGALQAKTAVDMFRGEQKAEPVESYRNVESGITGGPIGAPSESLHERENVPGKAHATLSSERKASPSTPERARPGLRRTWATRLSSTSRCRQKDQLSECNKRESVYSVFGRPSYESGQDPCGPEEFITPPEDHGHHRTHKKHDSFASSLVGSIRGLGRKRTAATTSANNLTQLQAAYVPLTSSPISIPTAPPELKLDLGPRDFMVSLAPEGRKDSAFSTFERLPGAKIDLGEKSPTTTSPTTTTDARSSSESNIVQLKPAKPRDLLGLSIEDLKHFIPSAAAGLPATPMPGTTFALEVDGAIDKPPVFERSVSQAQEVQRKQLRAMQSLDAMAEACAVAHQNDEIAAGMRQPNDQCTPEEMPFPNVEPLRIPNKTTPRRCAPSAETVQTVQSLPPEMPALSRQVCLGEMLQTAVPAVHAELDKALSDDPLADQHVYHRGPPSPRRRVDLPFRTKKLSNADSPQSDIVVESTEGTLSISMNARCSSGSSESIISRPEKLQRANASSEIFVGDAGPPQIATSFIPNQSVQTGSPKDNIAKEDPFQNPTSEDDTQTRAQLLLDMDIYIAAYENDTSPINDEEEASPHGPPLVVQPEAIISRFSTDLEDSPRSVLSYTAGLGETHYRFTFDNWLRDSSNAAAPADEPATPARRRLDMMSLDSVSTTGGRKTPQISPATTNADRRPSNGSCLEFDLKRNTRSNAQQQHDSGDSGLCFTPTFHIGDFDSIPAPSRHDDDHTFRFTISNEEETPDDALKLAEFDNAFDGTLQPAELRDSVPLDLRIASDDSVADSFKQAAHDYSQLEDQLDNADSPFADSDTTTEDPFRSPASETHKTAWEELLCRVPSPPPINHEDASKSSPPPPQCPWQQDRVASTSSTESKSTVTARHLMASPDTLDESLAMFSSPESGYQGDRSSVGKRGSSAERVLPARYHRKRWSEGKAKDIARNF